MEQITINIAIVIAIIIIVIMKMTSFMAEFKLLKYRVATLERKLGRSVFDDADSEEPLVVKKRKK